MKNMTHLFRRMCPTTLNIASKQNVTKRNGITTRYGAVYCHQVRSPTPCCRMLKTTVVANILCSTCPARHFMRSTIHAAHIGGVVLFRGASA